MKTELSAAEILELQQEGYSVHEVVDIEPIRYRWLHRSGASQADVKDRQPYRKSEAQAWVDCRNYKFGRYDSALKNDWQD
jgi:hypothetical protein